MTPSAAVRLLSTAPLFCVTVPGLPPSLWSCYGRNRDGKLYLRREGRDWKAAASWIARAEWRRARRWKPLRRPVFAVVELLHTQRPGRWDVENRLKLIFDAFTDAGVWEDDSLLRGHLALAHPVDSDEATRISLWEPEINQDHERSDLA